MESRGLFTTMSATPQPLGNPHEIEGLVYDINDLFTTLIAQNTFRTDFLVKKHTAQNYSTVTLLAKLRGLSTSAPRAQAV